MLNLEGLYCRTENLSERHVAQLRQGQRVNITLRTYPDDTVTGQVAAIVPQTERQSDSEARFVAIIRLDGSELDLLPGMTGRVEIVTGDE
jgi:multidrug efflux pump subunit AcrA (membrane-fusion protein)